MEEEEIELDIRKKMKLDSQSGKKHVNDVIKFFRANRNKTGAESIGTRSKRPVSVRCK